MKTNLHKAYQTNVSLEEEGVYCVINDDTKFLIARFNRNSNRVKKTLLRILKPHMREINAGTMKAEKELRKSVEILTHACILGWVGVKDENNNDIPFTKEGCIELLVGLPDLFHTLDAFANDMSNYKEDLSVELGNS